MKDILFVGLSLFIFSNNVLAKTCYEKSPNFASLGAAYYSVKSTEKIQGKDKDKLKKLLQAISGKWYGDVVISNCKGSDDASRKLETNATVKVVIPQQDKLKINAEMLFSESGKIKIRRYKLLRNEKIYSYKFKNDYYLLYSELIRVKNIDKGNRLVENFYEINLKDGVFKFIINYYVNGTFVGDERWALTRDN